VRECPQLSPPLPRWAGLGHRRQQDAVNRLERLRRKKRRTEQDQAEIDSITGELGVARTAVDVV
jgi:hypothetical protein